MDNILIRMQMKWSSRSTQGDIRLNLSISVIELSFDRFPDEDHEEHLMFQEWIF